MTPGKHWSSRQKSKASPPPHKGQTDRGSVPIFWCALTVMGLRWLLHFPCFTGTKWEKEFYQSFSISCFSSEGSLCLPVPGKWCCIPGDRLIKLSSYWSKAPTKSSSERCLFSLQSSLQPVIQNFCFSTQIHVKSTYNQCLLKKNHSFSSHRNFDTSCVLWPWNLDTPHPGSHPARNSPLNDLQTINKISL